MGNMHCLRAIIGRGIVKINVDGPPTNSNSVTHGTYKSYDDLTPTSIHDSDIQSVYGEPQEAASSTRHGATTESIRRLFGRLSHRRKEEIHSRSNLLNSVVNRQPSFNRNYLMPPHNRASKRDVVDGNSNVIIPRVGMYGDHGNVDAISRRSSISHVTDVGGPYTPFVTLGNYLLDIFEDFGETVAMIENRSDITFHELMLVIGKLCRSLAKRHFGRGHVLCFVSNNATYMVIFICAVTLLGGIIVPLDPILLVDVLPLVLKERRVHFIVADQSVCRYVQKIAWRAKLYRVVYCIGHCRGARSVNELVSDDDKQHHCTPHVDSHIDPKHDVAAIFYRKTEQGRSCRSASFTHYSMIVNIGQVGALVTDDIGTISLVCNSQNTNWRRVIGSILSSLVKGHTVVVTHDTSINELCHTMKQCVPQLIHLDRALFEEMLQQDVMKKYDWSKILRIFCVANGSLMKCVTKFELENKTTQLFGHPDSLFTHFATIDSFKQHMVECTPLARTRFKIIDTVSGHHLKAGLTGYVWVRGPQLSLHEPKLNKRVYDCYGWLNTETLGYLDTHGHVHIAIEDE